MTRDRTPPGPDEQSFYALITGCDISGRRYSWLRVCPDFSADDPDVLIGDNTGMKWNIFGDEPAVGLFTAYEANNARGLTDRIVKLTFAGFNENADATYVFDHQAEEPADTWLPIHDHRDNVTGGGFAFAVYHPGTSLPQQPWSV